MIYEYECSVCHKFFEEIKPVEERDNVFCCGEKADRIIVHDFETDDDLMYQGACYSFSHKPTEIYSRRQYKGLLREHGMVDTTFKEMAEMKNRTKFSDSPRKKIVKRMVERMSKDNVLHDVPGFMRDVVGLPLKKKKK